jgi:hypothetical protein
VRTAHDTEGGAQGRVMVDGTIINTGGGAGIMGMTGGYVADVANAQEVTVQLSGALGESETGGASINIIPRTGGNRFAGNYFVTYTQGTTTRVAPARWAGSAGRVPRTTAVIGISNGHPLIRDYDTRRSAGKSSATAYGLARRAWQGCVEPAAGPHLGQRERWPLGRITSRIGNEAAVDEQDAQRQRAPDARTERTQLLLGRGLPARTVGGSVAPRTARDGWWSAGASARRSGGVDNPLTNVIPRSRDDGEPAALRLLSIASA